MVIAVGSAYKTALSDPHARPVVLIRLDLTTGFRRFALWQHNVVFSGDTYFGMGPIEDVSAPEVSQETPLTEQGLAFMVQNDPSLLADLQQNCRGRLCTGWLVMLDDAGAPIGDEAITLWHKRMVPGQLASDQGKYTTSIGLESRFHRHRNRAPRTYSHSEQLKRDPTDFAFRDIGKSLPFTRDRWRQKSGFSD